MRRAMARLRLVLSRGGAAARARPMRSMGSLGSVLIWFMSGLWGVQVAAGDFVFAIFLGRCWIFVGEGAAATYSTKPVEIHSYSRHEWLAWFSVGGDLHPSFWLVVVLPLWFPVLCCLGSLLCFRRHQVDARSCCVCGYERKGLNASARCPECGRGTG